jgi:hypothetical protein
VLGLPFADQGQGICGGSTTFCTARSHFLMAGVHIAKYVITLSHLVRAAFEDIVK